MYLNAHTEVRVKAMAIETFLQLKKIFFLVCFVTNWA